MDPSFIGRFKTSGASIRIPSITPKPKITQADDLLADEGIAMDPLWEEDNIVVGHVPGDQEI